MGIKPAMYILRSGCIESVNGSLCSGNHKRGNGEQTTTGMFMYHGVARAMDYRM